jgi:hypothetical protein
MQFKEEGGAEEIKLTIDDDDEDDEDPRKKDEK